MNRSFTESTEAVTHDSDPKYLRFQRISDDPTKQAGEGVVVERIGTELALSTLESGDVPAVPGPRVGDLTGGTSNSVTLQLQPPVHNDDLTQTLPGGTAVFNDLTAGEITVHLLFTDTTTQDIVITAAELKACAIAQGYGAMSSTFINLLPKWYTLPAGKVIATATMTTTTAFATSGGLNATASYYLYLAINNPASLIVIAGTAHMNTGSTVTESPGAYTIQPGDYLGLSVTLIGGAVHGGVAEVSFTLDDSSVLGPFPITSGALKTLADSNGRGAQTQLLVLSTDLGWDLSGLVGHSIVSVTFQITSPFSSSGYLMYAGSNIAVIDGVVNAAFPFITSLGTYTAPFVAGPYATAPVMTVMGIWLADSSTYVDLLFPLDAASIVSAANSGQRLARSTVVDMYNSVLYPTYDGWTMGGLFASSMTANYTSSHSPTIQEPSLFTIGFSSSGAGAPFSDVDPLNVAGTWAPGVVQRPIAADARLQVGINLFPADVPASFGGNILTEPYEVRLRNLAAFKFHVYGPGTNQDTPGPTFDVVMFVSQGSPEKGDNSLREWAALPINWTNTLGPGFVDNAMASISVDEHFPNMPDNFGGALVFPAYNNNHGPFNYIRFLITPSEGKHNVDYVNMFLTITANAREVS
jgi:hypothetical protein